MNPRTPLEWLLRHGEYKDGQSTRSKRYPLNMLFGFVLPKSWAELGSPLKEPPLGTMASSVGQIPEDGGDSLPFLIEYRRIIEETDSRLRQLKTRYPDYAHAIEPKLRRRVGRDSCQ